MRKYYLAERLKNRHSSAEKLMLLMPLISVCLSAWLTKDYFIIDSYNWWYVILFPGMLAFICAAVGNRDQKMGNRAVLTLPVDIRAVWNGKVLYGVRCMGASLIVFLSATLIISFVFEQVWQTAFRISPTVGAQILAVAVLFVTSLWQIPFCLFLQQLVGRFPMVLLHVGSAFVLAVSLSLKPCFMLLPQGIPARMMCVILKILPNGLVAEPGSMTFTPELLEWKGIPMGILASLIWFFIFWVAGRMWSKRQVEK